MIPPDSAVPHTVDYLTPPPEIDPRSVVVLGISTTHEILFSAQSTIARSALDVSSVAFDQGVIVVDGRRLRLEGLATIQNSDEPGRLIVRIRFISL